MHIRAGYTIGFECASPTPMILMLSLRPERLGDLVTPQVMHLAPEVPTRSYTDGFGNVCTRLVAPPGRLTLSADFVVRDSGQPDPVVGDAIRHRVEDLPDEALVFLLGSRYCETEPLADMAWARFGAIEPGWARVQAIVDYTHDRIAFGYQHANAAKTAHAAHEEGRGVCRDFAHLAIALCRCVNIPARYCTGYLGDIGIDPIDAPMDFSAWFEAYMGGRWLAFDARHNTPRIGRIVMARGRDAADVAISTTFGASRLAQFEVICEEVAQAPPA